MTTTHSDIWLLVDSSGSMAEGQKLLQARGVVREIEQMVRLGYLQPGQIHLCSICTAGVKDIPWSPDDDYPSCLLSAEGSFAGTALVEYIRSSEGRIAVATVGFWRTAVINEVKEAVARKTPGRVRIIKLGSSAAYLHGDCVYNAESIWEALDGWKVK